MVIANELNASFLANGVVEVHGAAAGDEKNVRTPHRELADEVVGKLNRRASSLQCGSSEGIGFAESEASNLGTDFPRHGVGSR